MTESGVELELVVVEVAAAEEVVDVCVVGGTRGHPGRPDAGGGSAPARSGTLAPAENNKNFLTLFVFIA